MITPRRRRRGRALPYLLMAPALLLLAGMLYPFALGVYYSMTQYWLQYPNRFRFIWFDNYIDLLEEPLFAKAFEFTLGFTVVAVVVQVGLGLAVALFLHGRVPGRGVIRALMLMPLMIPPVITALMWKIMMASTEAGILNHMLSFIGMSPVNWFGSINGGDGLGPDHRHLGEPALRRADPAGRAAGPADRALRGREGRRRGPDRHLPLRHAAAAEPFIVLVVMFRAMDSLRIFDVIYATTGGGPNDATTNLHIMAYQYGFQWYQMGKGMAQAIVLLMLVVIVSTLLMRLWNRASERTVH